MLDIKPIRLKDFTIKGNFTIKCQCDEHFTMVQQFFGTTKDTIQFKQLLNINPIESFKNCLSVPHTPLVIDDDKITKFIIKYETIDELLKLREIFRVRASQFETRLMEKRKYNPFTNDFFSKLTEPIEKIYK